MKALFIMPHYHAATSANNINMLNIVYEMVKQGYTVDILCTDNNGAYTKESEEHGYKVITTYNVYNYAVKKWGGVFHAEKFGDFPAIVKIAIKGYCLVKALKKPFTDYFAVDAISRKHIIEAIDKKYDVIVSHSHPFAAHSIAKDLKKAGVSNKWVAVLLDPFVYNNIDPVAEIEKRKKAAEKILNDADIVYVLDGIQQYNSHRGWSPCYLSNTRNFYLTNMVDHSSKKTNNRKIFITYAGVFYQGLREPQIPLEILSNLPSEYVIRLYMLIMLQQGQNKWW